MPMSKSQRTLLAAELYRLGLRTPYILQLTGLSKDLLSKLHKDLYGKSARKGQLPYSIDWYMTWRNNLHSSLFLKIYSQHSAGIRELNLMDHVGTFPEIGDNARRFLNAYHQYLNHVESVSDDPILTGQRAYLATQLIGKAVWLAPCCECGQLHLVHAYSESGHFCGNCFVPSRIKDNSKTRNLGAK